MSKKTIFPVVLLFVFLAFSREALADELKLKNGDRLTGTIVKAD